MSLKTLHIDGHVVVISGGEAYERTLRELLMPDTYTTRIYNEDQIIVEKKKNPHTKTGQYYFAVVTIDGKEPPKHKG